MGTAGAQPQAQVDSSPPEAKQEADVHTSEEDADARPGQPKRARLDEGQAIVEESDN